MTRTPKLKAKKPAPQPTVNGVVKSLGDLMRSANCSKALQFVPELAWIFFLRFLDEREIREAAEAEAQGVPFSPTLPEPYRWRDWAAPDAPLRSGKKSKVWKFVHQSLLPALKVLKDQPDATPRQKLVSEIVSSVERSRLDSEPHFVEMLDTVHEIGREIVDETQLFAPARADFPLAQVFEEFLLKMSAKAHDGGEFSTPPAIIQAMVRVLDPRIGKTVYDPGCGTGGILVEAGKAMRAHAGNAITSAELDTLRRHTFYGRENDDAAYPIALANLVLHGIDEPHLGHGSAPSSPGANGGLMDGAPESFDCVLSNLSLLSRGSPKGNEPLMPDDSRMGIAHMLQHVLQSMKGGTGCGLVLDDRVLLDTGALAPTKQDLLEKCDVHCIVSLPAGVFPAAEAHARLNLVFFEQGQPTERIWYYKFPELPAGKKTPLTPEHFEEFFRLLPERADSERSWTVDFAARCQTANEGAGPLREAAAATAAWTKTLEKELLAAREAQVDTEVELQALEDQWHAALREAAETDAKAAMIEHAIYDLRALNPRSRAALVIDDDRLAQLFVVAEEHGRAVDGALARLQALLRQEPKL